MPKGGSRPRCSVDGCDRPHTARGLCAMHYQRCYRNPEKIKGYPSMQPEYRRNWIRNWYQRNLEDQREKARRRKIEATWGMPYEEYEALIAPGCAICGTTEGRICIDHDHETGQIRGPLCGGCNAGLGQFGDDPDRLRLAAAYLERHHAAREAARWDELFWVEAEKEAHAAA